MAIYRGAGGPGDATADSASTAQLAQSYATQAATSAASAIASAAAALASENAADSDATAAAASASAAASSATSAANSATAAAASASSASSSSSSAATSAGLAETAQTAAETAQTAAETAQTAAETAQAAAETAQGAAETAQAGAETAETGAEAAQAAAEAARDATLAAYDSFDDRYLGVKTSDPTLDNDGNALVAGSLYFNSVDEKMRLYTGSAWVDAYTTGSSFLQIANNLSDLASASTARTNLGLGTAATTAATDYATSAQGALADSATQPGDNVSTLTNDAGYLTSFTETDPVFSASPAAGITNTKITNWDTAYGWGNHATAGYLTSETYTGTVTSVDMSVPTGLSVSGNPVTSSGTLAVTYSAGYAIPTTVKQGNWDDAYTFTAAFPTQTGNAGKYLTTDGSVLSWGDVDALPDQTGNAGEYLTTDGTTASWAAIPAGGQYLGSAAVKAIAYNAQTIGENLTVLSTYNSMSVGPITVNSGYTVTVESGARWVVI